MRIQHNIAALNSYRNLTGNNNAVSKNLEKLSSGYRINRAGDDAAGLAISEKMRAQITGLKTAQKNANDGISLVQTAEGALTEVHSMLNRMVELADQSANGTYDNDVDRANLQKELDSLKSEIDRISEGTNFNGINLLDGSLAGSKSAGGLTGGTIANFKGATIGAVGTDASTTPAAATAGKFTIQVTAGMDSTAAVTFTGASNLISSGTVTYTGVDGSSSAADTASGIAAAITGSANFRSDLWEVTVEGDTITFTNKVAGDTTAVNVADSANLDKEGTAGVAAKGIDYFAKDTINVDGTEVKVDWSKLSDTEKAALQKDWQSTANPKLSDGEAAAKVIQDTINESIKKHNALNGTNLSEIKVEATGGGTGTAVTFNITSGQKDGNSKVAFTGTANSVLGQTFGTSEIKTADPVSSLNFSPTDANGKFTMKLDDQNVTVNLSGLTSTSDADDLTGALENAINDALTRYDNANSLTGDNAMSGKIKVKLNADGALEFTNTTGKKISFEDIDDGEVAKTLGISTEGKTASNGGLTLQIGDTADDFNQITVSVGAMDTTSLGLSGISIGTQAGAKSAVSLIKKAINSVSSTRGDLGAIQNRLEHTINNLSVTTENMTAAESRIRDVDMADEMMNYTKNNILVQASQAMLAQANQIPQGVLQLLQ